MDIGGNILENNTPHSKTYQLLIIVEVNVACFQCKHDISSESFISEGDKNCELNVECFTRYLYESFSKEASLDYFLL